MKDGKLTSKTVFNRETLKRIQEEFPKYLLEKGFNIECGEENSQHKKEIEKVNAKHSKLKNFLRVSFIILL